MLRNLIPFFDFTNFIPEKVLKVQDPSCQIRFPTILLTNIMTTECEKKFQTTIQYIRTTLKP